MSNPVPRLPLARASTSQQNPITPRNPQEISTEPTPRPSRVDQISMGQSRTREATEFSTLHRLLMVHLDQVLSELEEESQTLHKINPTVLPPDVWVSIFSFLSPSLICPSVRVCRFFRLVTAHDAIWKKFWRQSVKQPSKLQPREKTWKLKFQFCSNWVVKAGFVSIRSGTFWSSWDPNWIVLSGMKLYCFAMEPDQKKQNELNRRVKLGLDRILALHKPSLVIPLYQSKLRKDTGFIGNEKYKFGLKQDEIDAWFAAPDEQERDQWVETLRLHIISLNRSFDRG